MKHSYGWGQKNPKEIQAHFNSIFEKRCLLSGDVFFRSSEEQERRWCAEVLKNRGFFGQTPRGYKLFRKLCQPWTVAEIGEIPAVAERVGWH